MTNPGCGPLVMAEKWNSVVKNLAGSFEIRLVQDQYVKDRANLGFFYAVVNGTKLGNFDISYEPRARELLQKGTPEWRRATDIVLASNPDRSLLKDINGDGSGTVASKN